MSQNSFHVTLASPAQTAELAVRLGSILRPGDVLLLDGPIGAGKTHFARSLIQSMLVEPEDVPSPTFTLVQTYDADQSEIWHADLYRLTNPDEVVELGLVDAFDTAICLVEWPDRLGTLKPHRALILGFSTTNDEDIRQLHVTWDDPTWSDRLKGIWNG